MYFDRFDIADAYYWWLTDHHSGQWSREYARLCKLSKSFTPSRLANGPDSENAQEIYSNLCAKKKCSHD